MTDPSGRERRKSKQLSGRVREGIQLWNDARRSAKFDDSIFIWIPKNAGTSVHTILQDAGLVKLTTTRAVRLCFRNAGRVTFGHMDIQSLVDLGLVSPAFVDKAFKFAFSRDPYARALSLHSYLSRIDVLKNWHKQPSLTEFLTLLADGFYDRIGPYNWRGLSQCNPQVEWLRSTPADKIYKVEEMENFLDDIGRRFGIHADSMPRTNTSPDQEKIALGKEDKRLIERIYSEDFDRLGYPRR